MCILEAMAKHAAHTLTFPLYNWREVSILREGGVDNYIIVTVVLYDIVCLQTDRYMLHVPYEFVYH